MLFDARPLGSLKPDDSPEPNGGEPSTMDDQPAPQPTMEVVRAPRRVRAQLVQLDGQILAHQDIAEELYAYVRDPNGRKLLGKLYGGLEETHQLLQRTCDAVERG